MEIKAKDVESLWVGYTGYLPNASPQARRKVGRSTVTLTHRPTGVTVSRDLPRRAFSRRDMQDELLKLRRQLFAELGRAVARLR